MPYLLDHGPMPTEWAELRDDNGHLYGRVQPDEWLLEIRRNGRVAVFRLSDYLWQIETVSSTVGDLKLP